MLVYTVRLKGRKEPVQFVLPDDALLKQYHEYLSTGNNPIGSYLGADARKAVIDFREVQLMNTHPVDSDTDYSKYI
jgi:hypothetical protein